MPVAVPCEHRRGPLDARCLFHGLLDDETRPAVRDDARSFLTDWLQRVSVMPEPPSAPPGAWSAGGFEDWFARRYEEQVASYRPLAAQCVERATVEREVRQDAPFALVDGAWLQGVVAPGSPLDPVRRLLFATFWDEVGGGDVAANHANLFRRVLVQVASDLPDVRTTDFAHHRSLFSEAFECPAFMLALGEWPRSFFPELVGFNAAVELSGIGGPFLAASERFTRMGLDATYLVLHNAIDNVANGHSAWAREAVLELADRAASLGVDPEGVWQRVRRGYLCFDATRWSLREALMVAEFESV